MPWKERSIVEERMRFVLRLKDGESMASQKACVENCQVLGHQCNSGAPFCLREYGLSLPVSAKIQP
jgi:hypothetical protein